MTIYQKGSFAVYKMDIGFIVHNTDYDFESAHTHLNSFNMCMSVIDNCLKHKKPKTKNRYILESHKRICKDEKYYNFIEQLMAKDPKQSYTR